MPTYSKFRKTHSAKYKPISKGFIPILKNKFRRSIFKISKSPSEPSSHFTPWVVFRNSGKRPKATVLLLATLGVSAFLVTFSWITRSKLNPEVHYQLNERIELDKKPNPEILGKQNYPKPVPEPPQYRVRPIIVLDAGHALITRSLNVDPGAGNDTLNESPIALEIVERVAAGLKNNDLVPILTRKGNATVLNKYDRIKLANKLKANVFISLHINSSPDNRAGGCTTYYYRNNQKGLAHCIQNRLVEKTELRDRGVATGRFAVLTAARVPSVLVEPAFLSKPAEAKLLELPDFKEKIAEGIVAGIIDFLKTQNQIQATPITSKE